MAGNRLRRCLFCYVPAKPAVAATGITSAIAGQLADKATAGGVDATSIADGTATLNNPAPGIFR